MKNKRLVLFLTVFLLSLSLHTLSQNGACCRAVYFDIDTAPDPPIFTGIGDSHWPIKTSSDSCQIFFDQGIRQGHCFNDFEAMRAFRKALKLDPECAMCYWGIVVSESNAEPDYKAARKKLDKANELNEQNKQDSLYELQRVIIEMAKAEYLGLKDKKAEKKFRKLCGTLPDRYRHNLEYLLIISGMVGDGYDTEGEPLKGQEERRSILKEAMALAPDNFAVQHYWIHANEAGKYIDSARHAAEILPILAPGSPHIIHMPGHIYFRLGEYRRADSAFYKAFIADSIYMSRYHISSYNDWNYIHNLNFMVHNKIEMGDMNAALHWQEKIDTIPVLESCKNSGRNDNNYGLWFNKALLPMRCHDWALAEEYAAELGDRFDATGVMDKHAVFLAALTFLEQYAKFCEVLESGNSDKALQLANDLISFNKEFIHRKAHYYRHEDYYGAVRDMLDIYAIKAEAYVAEKSGNMSKAEIKLEAAIKREKQSRQSEPPDFFISPMEWKIEYYIRTGRLIDAALWADYYSGFSKNSPYAAYYKALVAEKQDKENYKEFYRESLQLFVDQDMKMARRIKDKLK